MKRTLESYVGLLRAVYARSPGGQQPSGIAWIVMRARAIAAAQGHGAGSRGCRRRPLWPRCPGTARTRCSRVLVVAVAAGEVVLEHAGAGSVAVPLRQDESDVPRALPPAGRGISCTSRARLEQERVHEYLSLGAGLPTPGVAGGAGGHTTLKTRHTRTRTTE